MSLSQYKHFLHPVALSALRVCLWPWLLGVITKILVKRKEDVGYSEGKMEQQSMLPVCGDKATRDRDGKAGRGYGS